MNATNLNGYATLIPVAAFILAVFPASGNERQLYDGAAPAAPSGPELAVVMDACQGCTLYSFSTAPGVGAVRKDSTGTDGECWGTRPNCFEEAPCNPSGMTIVVTNNSGSTIWVEGPGSGIRTQINSSGVAEFTITHDEAMDCGSNYTALLIYNQPSGGTQIGIVEISCSQCI